MPEANPLQRRPWVALALGAPLAWALGLGLLLLFHFTTPDPEEG